MRWVAIDSFVVYVDLPLLIGCNYSFIGLSGGAIFHEMMLRHGVKVCHILLLKVPTERVMLTSETYSMSLDTQEELFCLSSTPSIIPTISISSYPVTSKEQVIWQKAMPELQGNLASC